MPHKAFGNVISLSWGAPEAAINGLGNNTQVMQAHQNFLAAKAANISVFVSSGDFGASNQYPIANASYPASDPLVTSVGGTNLFMNDAGSYQSEDVSTSHVLIGDSQSSLASFRNSWKTRFPSRFGSCRIHN